ncbi:MAG: hypothetical protein V3R94_11670 [Acidobacteriota bacterium]
MFESKVSARSPNFWKFVIASVAILAVVLSVITFLLLQGESGETPLTGILRENAPDYDWYQKYLRLKNPQVKMTNSLSGNRLVLFSAVIENGGERTVDVVEVELSFFNYDELVSTAVKTPIRPGPASRTPPIETFEERGFTLYVEDLPDDWMALHAEMAIHGIRFVER